VRAVILAGGAGLRLEPHTSTTPKALLPIAGEPMLAIILAQLAEAGATHVTLAVGHLADQLEAFGGDGSRWGVRLDYACESRPLGTVGPLTLIDDLPEDFLVVNGDVLSDLDHGALFAAHRASGDALTLAVARWRTQLAFGVVRCEGAQVRGFDEKPAIDHQVSMGIYAMRRRLLARVPPHSRYGFDALIGAALAGGDRLGAVHHTGYWIDIGTPEAYARAEREWPARAPRPRARRSAPA
jgi:NDP-sugar pyrophosphorylase family protein